MRKAYKPIVLILVIVFMCSSCSLFSGSQLKTEKIVKNYEELDYEQADFDDICDAFEDVYYTEHVDRAVENGVYSIITSERDMKRIFNSTNVFHAISRFFDYDKHMEQLAWFVRMDISNDTFAIINSLSIQFDSEDKASKYFEDMYESVEDINDDLEDVDTDIELEVDGGVLYLIGRYYVEPEDVCIHYGIYQQGRYVFIISSFALGTSKGERELDNICELIDVVSPTDV